MNTADLLPHDYARALLEWHVELGACDPISETPVDRYTLAVKPRVAAARRVSGNQGAPPAPVPEIRSDPIAEARARAARASTLAQLADEQESFDGLELKRGARKFVFADGDPAARVMIIGEAPGREEDIEGRPFVGRAGRLLDRMFAAIGYSRTSANPTHGLYITNVLPWRPPQNRDPESHEIAAALPFLARHIELVDPEVLVLLGNTACVAALGARGISRLRGKWTQAFGRPSLPMNHPSYLLRTPLAKREAWADLLELNAKLVSMS